MASKKAAPTDDELNDMLKGIGDSKPKQSNPKAPRAARANASQTEQDLLAELGSLAAKPPTSRPHTPRISSVKPASNRTSEDRSGESVRQTSFTPSATSSDLQDAEKKNPIAQPAEAEAESASSGWWGGIFATASATVKAAEAAVKEIQQNEEAKRWADQVRGNVGVLKGFGMSN